MIWQAFLRGAAVIVVAALLTAALSRRSAAIRHHIWASALLVQLALLALIPVMPTLSVPFPTAPPQFRSFSPLGNTTAPLPARTTSVQNVSPTTSSPSASIGADSPSDWRTPLLYIWAVGAALIFLRYLLGTLMMARVAQHGRRVDEGEWLTLAQRVARDLAITRPVTLLWGDKLAVPITWGILYPMILLPGTADEWSAERRRFVLVHEMAHVRRFDALTQLVAQLTLAVFWFSPFVWLCEWRLRVEREHACDDVVLQQGTEPTIYADELLQMVRSLISRKTARPAFAALAMARRSEFEGRMLAILDSTRTRRVSGVGSAFLFIGLSLSIAAPLAALKPYPHDELSARISPAVTAKGADTSANPPEVAWDDCSFRRIQTSVHSLIDKQQRIDMKIKVEAENKCSWLMADGGITFRDDDQYVQTMLPGSNVLLREVTRTEDRKARLTAVDNGQVTTIYTVNGRDADPAEARGWIARVMPQLLRESSDNADRRVQVLLSAYGLRGTLARIESITSSSRTSHYQALLRARNWSMEEFGQIGSSQSRSMKR